MAICKYCGKSGWFLSLTDAGVCDNCAQILQPQINRAVDIVMESVEIVNTSKNLETKLSRCNTIEVIINKVLRPLEERGIKTLEGGQTPSEVLAYVRDFRDRIIPESLKDALGEAKTKAETAKTAKTKINAYSKVLQKIAKLKDKVSNPSLIEDVESEVKRLIDQTQMEL
jgi:hypothetical protein